MEGIQYAAQDPALFVSKTPPPGFPAFRRPAKETASKRFPPEEKHPAHTDHLKGRQMYPSFLESWVSLPPTSTYPDHTSHSRAPHFPSGFPFLATHRVPSSTWAPSVSTRPPLRTTHGAPFPVCLPGGLPHPTPPNPTLQEGTHCLHAPRAASLENSYCADPIPHPIPHPKRAPTAPTPRMPPRWKTATELTLTPRQLTLCF